MGQQFGNDNLTMDLCCTKQGEDKLLHNRKFTWEKLGLKWPRGWEEVTLCLTYSVCCCRVSSLLFYVLILRHSGGAHSDASDASTW